MFVIDLLIMISSWIVVGLIITQYVVPVVRGTQTWWLFRKSHPQRLIEKVQAQLARKIADSKLKKLKNKLDQ